MNPTVKPGDVYRSEKGHYVLVIRVKPGMPFHVGGQVRGYQSTRATLVGCTRTGKPKKISTARAYDALPFHSMLRDGDRLAPGYKFIANTKTDRTEELMAAKSNAKKKTIKKTASKKTAAAKRSTASSKAESKKPATKKTARKSTPAKAPKSPWAKPCAGTRYDGDIPARTNKWEYLGLTCMTPKELQDRLFELTGKRSKSVTVRGLAHRISTYVKANAPKSVRAKWEREGRNV